MGWRRRETKMIQAAARRNAAYVAAFGDHRPARSAVAVAGLPRDATVEVEAWARKVAG